MLSAGIAAYGTKERSGPWSKRTIDGIELRCISAKAHTKTCVLFTASPPPSLDLRPPPQHLVCDGMVHMVPGRDGLTVTRQADIGCWGEELGAGAAQDHRCVPFKREARRLDGKFCPECKRAGVLVPVSRVRKLPTSTAASNSTVKSSFWNQVGELFGSSDYRIVGLDHNGHSKYVIFKTPPPSPPALSDALPENFLLDGHVTVIPIRDGLKIIAPAIAVTAEPPPSLPASPPSADVEAPSILSGFGSGAALAALAAVCVPVYSILASSSSSISVLRAYKWEYDILYFCTATVIAMASSLVLLRVTRANMIVVGGWVTIVMLAHIAALGTFVSELARNLPEINYPGRLAVYTVQAVVWVYLELSIVLSMERHPPEATRWHYMHRYFVANVYCVTLMVAAMFALTGEWESACLASNDYEACIYGRAPVGNPVSVLDMLLFVMMNAASAIYSLYRSVLATPASWRAWRMARQATRNYPRLMLGA